MSSFLRVAYLITWNPKEISGGTFLFQNQTFYVHGSGILPLQDIAESLNLTLEPYFGDYFESYNFVINGTAEMGGSLASQDDQWTRGLAYLHPLDSETSNVYFRQPPVDSAKYTITRPFSSRLWTILVIFLLLVAILFRRNSKGSKFATCWKTIINAVELFIGRHDVHIKLKKLPASAASTKLVMSIFGIIISSVYTGKISSIFVMREDLVKTPNDLIRYKYKLNTYSDIHINRMFEKAKNVTGELINFTKDLSYVTNVIGKLNEDPRQTLFSHPDGFFPPALYWLNYSQELCSISVLKSIRKTARSFYIRKDSKLREDINIRIVQLLERGINNRHQTNFKNKFYYSCIRQRTEFNQLTFKYVVLGFVPLFFGFTVAFGLGMFEYLTECKTKVKETKGKISLHLFVQIHSLDCN